MLQSLKGKAIIISRTIVERSDIVGYRSDRFSRYFVFFVLMMSKGADSLEFDQIGQHEITSLR